MALPLNIEREVLRLGQAGQGLNGPRGPKWISFIHHIYKNYMRLDVLVKRAARNSQRYHRLFDHSRYNPRDAALRLSANFGASVKQLPPSLRTELLSPQLQKFPHRSSLFQSLEFTGRLLLDILINDHLGTRTVEIPSHVVQKFCDLRDIGSEVGSHNAPALLYQCVGAVNIFCGDEECREMVHERILSGTNGIAKVFLDDLSQRRN